MSQGSLIKEVMIKLSVPSKLKTPLNLAKQKKEGFLMKDRIKMFGERTTEIGYKF
jgi:hypothetical protein